MNKKKVNLNQKLNSLLHDTLKSRGLTLSDAAEHVGVSYIYMASISNGARKIVGLKLEKQRKLAAFLGISMVDFFMLAGMLRPEDMTGA